MGQPIKGGNDSTLHLVIRLSRSCHEAALVNVVPLDIVLVGSPTRRYICCLSDSMRQQRKTASLTS